MSTDLKERIKSHERQNQRLKEVFKTASHEFREAVYTLLGYKVDGLPNKIYRLSNMYAEASDDHLLFKVIGCFYVRMYVYIYTYLHICIHTNVYIFIYVYIFVFL